MSSARGSPQSSPARNMPRFIIKVAALLSSWFSVNRPNADRGSQSQAPAQGTESVAGSAPGCENASRRFKFRKHLHMPDWLPCLSNGVAHDPENIRFEEKPPLDPNLSAHEITKRGLLNSENTASGTSTDKLEGAKLLEDVVDRLRSAEQRTERLECWIHEHCKTRHIVDEKIYRIAVLEKKLALFQIASEDNVRLDTIANDWQATSARMRDLKAENENLLRQLEVEKTESAKELSKLASKLRKKNRSIRNTETMLTEALKELTRLKKCTES